MLIERQITTAPPPAPPPPVIFRKPKTEVSREERQYKSKSVLLPGTPPEMAYAPDPGNNNYYDARSPMGTELKKTVRMDESTENSRRIVTVEQTSRVINFGRNRPTSGDFTTYRPPPAEVNSQQQQHRHSFYHVPTPKKFVRGQFRESDYESDVEQARIRPKWTPAESDNEDPRYRRVCPPSTGTTPTRMMERHEAVVTPMEFDKGPLKIPTTATPVVAKVDAYSSMMTQKDVKQAANRKR